MCKELDGGKQGPRPGMGDEHDKRVPEIETGVAGRKGGHNRGRVAVLVVLRSHSSEHDFTGYGVLRPTEQRWTYDE
jgi:hypothetical protein